jgi:hypothetical protein
MEGLGKPKRNLIPSSRYLVRDSKRAPREQNSISTCLLARWHYRFIEINNYEDGSTLLSNVCTKFHKNPATDSEAVGVDRDMHKSDTRMRPWRHTHNNELIDTYQQGNKARNLDIIILEASIFMQSLSPFSSSLCVCSGAHSDFKYASHFSKMLALILSSGS